MTTMNGGAGDDIYVVDSADDLIQEGAGQGTDTVVASVDYMLPDNVENLTLTGFASSATGNTLDNVLTANDQGNWLDGGDGSDTLIGGQSNDMLWGGTGADTMQGGAGDDFYVVDDAGDLVVEATGAGVDAVIASVDHTLSDNVENLSWFDAGSGVGVAFTGNALSNTVTGSSFDDLLSGQGGDDTLVGLDGNDRLDGGSGNDVLDDTSGINQLFGGDGNDNITGAGLLSGGVGNDSLVGANLTSDDTYIFNLGDGQDQAWDAGGTDVLQFGPGITPSSIALIRTGNDLVFAANANDQMIVKDWFLNANRRIEGVRFDDGTTWDQATILALPLDHAPTVNMAIADSLAGSGEVIYKSFKGAFGDIDMGDVLTYSATLANGDSLPDWLTIDGATQQFGVMASGADVGVYSVRVIATDLSGASTSSTFQLTVLDFSDRVGDDVIVGTNADDQLFGGAGNDTLSGGVGNDSLYGGVGNDRIDGGAGDDVIDGGEGADTITDTSGNNNIKGGLGNDSITGTGTMEGGAGDDAISAGYLWSGDTYVFNLGDGKDSIAEYGVSAALGYGQGYDDTLKFGVGIEASAVTLVRSGNDLIFKVSETDQVAVKDWFIDAGFRYIEQVQFADGTKWDVAKLQTMAIEAYSGTASADTINGWGGIDIINGLAGNDVISGAGGNDVLDGGEGDDNLSGGDGNDRLLGGVGNDRIDGGAGDDVIDGGEGADTITDTSGTNDIKGGLGNDSITGTGTMEGGAGDDAISAGYLWSGDTYVFNLGDGKDSIAEYGVSAALGYGQGYDDTLKFGVGIEASAVTLVRSGNDLIFKVSETDQVAVKDWFADSGFRYIEQVQFADGTKWTVDTLRGMQIQSIGTVNADVITGWDGQDRIEGGAGNDTLNGGTGNDTYIFASGTDSDTISDYDPAAGNNDLLSIAASITTGQLWFRQVGSNLEVSLIGTGDKATISNWYSGNAYHVELFKTSDGKTLVDSQVQALVSAMAAFAPPAAGQTSLPVDYQAALNPVIAANWT